MTDTSQIPAEVSAFYDRVLLERARPQLIHAQFAQIRDIPKNAGTKVVKFRRYGNLAPATTPLTEGVTPAGKNLSVTDITATCSQYGDYITVSDVLSYTSQDPNLMDGAEVLGDQASETFDQLMRDVLAASTSRFYGGSGNVQTSDVAAGDVVTTALLDSVVLELKNNKAKKVLTKVDASTGYNTTPIRASYVAYVHTNIAAKVAALTGFVGVEKYPAQTTVLENEIGYYKEIRFVESPDAKVYEGAGTGGIDVYPIVVFGRDSHGMTRISGESLTNIVKPLGSGGTADPLNQRATSGWKGEFVGVRLNDLWIQVLEVSLT